MTKETDLILFTSSSKALLKKGYSKEKPSSDSELLMRADFN
jgi:hypothetical protein